MKLKGIILVGLMLVILTAGAVSASGDVNDTMSADKFAICENLTTTDSDDASLESIEEDPVAEDDVTVSFNSTGGEGSMADFSIAKGSNFTLPESQFSKINRTFYGWNVGDAIKHPGENLTLTDNLTIKAVWRYDTDLDDNTILRKKEAIYSVDLSQVWADGWLHLTDLRKDRTEITNITLGPMPATYLSADTYNVSGFLINNTIKELMKIAESQSKGKSINITNQTITPDYVWDAQYNVTSFYADLYEGADDLIKSVKFRLEYGTYYAYWFYQVVIWAEYESSPLTDMADVRITLSKDAFTYNGKAQKPTVYAIKGVVLNQGTDYDVRYVTNSINAGKYNVIVIGKGNYTGNVTVGYQIAKASNPLKLSAKTCTVKFASLKKKSQALAISKAVKFTKKGQGKMIYAKASGNKKISINKSTGKITVAKGLGKGTYKVKVKIRANGNANYLASGYKTVTFTLRVK